MTIHCRVHRVKPKNFNATIEVSGCYCEWFDKILLVKRHPQKPQGNTWGIPSGKLEKNESPTEAVIREVMEEVGLNIDTGHLKFLYSLYCQCESLHFIYHVFSHRWSIRPEIHLALVEHTEFLWTTIDQAFQCDLISGGKEALKFYQISQV